MTETAQDSGYLIGSTHGVCEDYAIAGTANDLPYAIVSDGCSSSQFVDVGARLLAHGAVSALSDRGDSWGAEGVVWYADKVRRLLLLPPRALDATLLVVEGLASHFRVSAFGDGVVVARERQSGDLYIRQLEYPSGFPAYLSYVLSPTTALLDFRLSSGRADWEFVVHEWTLYAATVGVEFYSRSTTGIIGEVGDIARGCRFYYDYDKYDMVAVLSDGAATLARRFEIGGAHYEEAVPVSSAVRQLCNFKSAGNGFVARRLMRFLAESRRDKQFHRDDLSVAAMIVR